MDLEGATFLYTLATLMITFAGFSALLFVIRQAAGAKLSLLDRFIVRNIMTYVFVLTAAALMPPLLAIYGVDEGEIWWISGILFALPMLALQTTYSVRRRKLVGEGAPFSIMAVFVVLGSAVTFAMLVCILVDVRHAAAIYIGTLTIDFFTVIYGFVNALDIIMQQPTDK